MGKIYVFDKVTLDLFPNLRRFIGQRWYEYISRMDRDARMVFMNYGYDPLDPDAKPLELSAEEEEDRYAIQLYHHVASAIDWVGLEALEVGSGRGGGAAYIKRRFKPKSLIGVDKAARAIDFCSRHYSVEGLSFIRGEAESLEFNDDSFDVVVTVEASGLMSMERFLGEVARVLRPDGYFLYADICWHKAADAREAQLSDAGLQLISKEDITPNVVRALVSDSARRERLISEHVPQILCRVFREFSGTTGAGLAQGSPKAGDRLYLNLVLRKT